MHIKSGPQLPQRSPHHHRQHREQSELRQGYQRHLKNNKIQMQSLDGEYGLTRLIIPYNFNFQRLSTLEAVAVAFLERSLINSKDYRHSQDTAVRAL